MNEMGALPNGEKERALIPSRAAISLLRSPLATPSKTSRSRSVNLATGEIAFVQIQVQVDSTAALDRVKQDATTLLEQRHRIRPGKHDDFSIIDSNQLVQTVQSSVSAEENLLIAIAAISLLVGSIGIMNIMLVSVMERTREIGIRLAIGAQPSDIRNQFLVEALSLSMIGGGIGIIAGLAVGIVLTNTYQYPLAAWLLFGRWR